MYPKSRIDALTDGIFAVAMTLLVLDLRLPAELHLNSNSDLVRALWDQMPKFLPYVISFLSLGLRWLANLGDRDASLQVSRSYARWWLFYLLLVTCLPFSTTIVGTHQEFSAAICLYACNTLLLAIASYRMTTIMPEAHSEPRLRQRQVATAASVAASSLAIGWSFVSPHSALWAYLLLIVIPAAANRRTE